MEKSTENAGFGDCQNASEVQEKLIFDIGFHVGNDTAYYLSRGYRVVAVEANPSLADEGRRRFNAEIASGHLTILNVAMSPTSGAIIPFYINDIYSAKSSLDPARAQKWEKYHRVEVEGVTIGELFKTWGVPWYLKMDIEGADEMVVRTLPQGGPVPKYFSCELGHGRPIAGLLSSHGYTGFKLINGGTLTQSVDIYDSELFMRALRKVGGLCPPVHSLIAGLPDGIRPKKTLWDPPRTRLPHLLTISQTTGPFAEETDGPWLSIAEMNRRLDYLFGQCARDGVEDTFWYDLHARHASAG